jgi:hypothetical protein
METEATVRLEFSNGREPMKRVGAINEAIKQFGARVSPVPTGDAPAGIRALLAQTTLTPAESEQVKAHFLLPRERLLDVISEAGREPQVPGGGALTTHVSPYDYDYPQLYVAEADVDYGRFERFHVNAAEDGTGVDEILQMLWGRGLEVHLRTPDATVLTLRLDCPARDRGWIVTYDGNGPHIATISNASPGTKVLVQVIGAERWIMKYVD